MKGHTNKHRVQSYSADFSDYSVDVDIYSSGGVKHTVEARYIYDSGEAPVHRRTFNDHHTAAQYAESLVRA